MPQVGIIRDLEDWPPNSSSMGMCFTKGITTWFYSGVWMDMKQKFLPRRFARDPLALMPMDFPWIRKILKAGYYWMTMEIDYFKYVKKCHKCQIYADNVHMPPIPLNVLTAPWPFSMWGIDIIGMVEPKVMNRHHFILVAIDYFTKWVEATSYTKVTRQAIARFIKNEIICRYRVPNKIITDNGFNLNNKVMDELCESFKIEHHNSSPYRPKMNDAVEATNKNIKKII